MKAAPRSQLPGSIMAGICLRKEEGGLVVQQGVGEAAGRANLVAPSDASGTPSLALGLCGQSTGVTQEQEVQALCGELGWEVLCRKPACVEGLFSLKRGRRLSTAPPHAPGHPCNSNQPTSLPPGVNRASLFCKLFQWTCVWAQA